MAKLRFRAAPTRSQSLYVKLLDNTATNGAGKTGLVAADVDATIIPYQGVPSGLTINVDLAQPDSAFQAGGFVEVSAALCPGLYRIDIDNSAFTSSPSVIICVYGSTFVDVESELQLDDTAEPTSGNVPAADAELEEKVNWLFALARNEIRQTATTQSLRNDANSGDIATSATSDTAGTFTRGEWS